MLLQRQYMLLKNLAVCNFTDMVQLEFCQLIGCHIQQYIVLPFLKPIDRQKWFVE